MPVARKTLFLRNYMTKVDIGIYDHEIGHPQNIIINADIDVDWDFDKLTDDITDVVDYDYIRNGIQELVTNKRYNLQERLCADILSLIIANTDVAAVTLSVRKPDIYPDCDSVGFELSWVRDRESV